MLCKDASGRLTTAGLKTGQIELFHLTQDDWVILSFVAGRYKVSGFRYGRRFIEPYYTLGDAQVAFDSWKLSLREGTEHA